MIVKVTLGVGGPTIGTAEIWYGNDGIQADVVLDEDGQWFRDNVSLSINVEEVE